MEDPVVWVLHETCIRHPEQRQNGQRNKNATGLIETLAYFHYQSGYEKKGMSLKAEKCVDTSYNFALDFDSFSPLYSKNFLLISFSRN